MPQDVLPSVSESKPHFAFVVPRYGDMQVGGAETLVRLFAEQLVSRQLAKVTVLTTCASRLDFWANDLTPGPSELGDVNVLRFPIDHVRRNQMRWLHLHNLVITGAYLSPAEQFEWVDQHYHAPELYWHLHQNRTTYHLCFFIPRSDVSSELRHNASAFSKTLAAVLNN